MRLTEIARVRSLLGDDIQPLQEGDISDNVHNGFRVIRRDSFRRSAIGFAAGFLQNTIRRQSEQAAKCRLSFHYDAMTVGERFADDLSRRKLLKFCRRQPPGRVLVPGCYMGGEDIQFWLRRGIREMVGIDVYSLDRHWQQIVPALENEYQIPVTFEQASIEKLPFEAESFNLIATTAVLEHVRNLRAMVSETARVLKPGGICWHVFGPLYYSFGADHCISAYGFERGYDHLLLDENEYQSLIHDQSFFDTQDDPNLPFWARREQFSYAAAARYLKLFAEEFSIEHVVVKMSPDGLRYREVYPERWSGLLDAGVPEEDLLIKSLAVVLRKP